MKIKKYDIDVKKIISIIFLIMFAFHFLKFTYFFETGSMKIDEVEIQKGNLNWKSDKRIANLKGEAIWYKDLLIPYGSFAPEEKDYVSVPYNLEKLRDPSKRSSRGTYNINIKNLDDDENYALYMGDVYISHRVWANGKLLCQSGFFSSQKRNENLCQDTMKLKSIDGEINIWVQVVNDYNYRKMGIFGPLKFGIQRDVNGYMNFMGNINNLMIGTMFTISFISGLVYLFNREHEMIFHFFFLSFFVMVHTMIQKNMFLSANFHVMTFIWRTKVEMISIFFIIYFIYGHFYYFYEDIMSSETLKLVKRVAIASTIIIMVIPFEYISIIWYMEAIYAFSFIVFQMKSLYEKLVFNDPYAKLNFLGFLFIGLCSAYDLVASIMSLKSYDLLSIGWIGLLLTQIIIMSMKESSVYEALEMKLDQRTRAIIEKENILNRAQEIANMGSWSWDVRTQKIAYTKGLQKLYGFEDREYPFEELYEKLVPEYIKNFYDKNSGIRNVDGKKLMDNENVYIDREGKERWFKIEGDVINAEDGYIRSIICNIQDVTEFKLDRDNLRRASITDGLTRIYNKVKINEDIEFMVNMAKNNQGLVFSLIMFDIDHFKRVNDNYGHIVGDNVLVELTNLVKGRIRKEDIFARWGGEEFLILIPDTDANKAEGIANKLRLEIEKHSFKIVKDLTVSFGVTVFNDGDDLNSIVERVDEALYAAKKAGRNLVVKKI